MKLRLALLIGLRQLAADPQRTAGSLIGVALAIALILTLGSIRDSLYESTVTLPQSLDADLVLVAPRFAAVLGLQRFPLDALFEAAAVPGVASARPLYVDIIPWRNPATGIPRAILLYAFNPDAPVLLLSQVNRMAAALRQPGTLLFDRSSRPEFGPVAARFAKDGDVEIALDRERRGLHPRIRVAGLYTLGPGFVVDGDAIAGDLTFYDITGVSLDRVSFGVLKIDSGASVRSVQAAVQDRVGDAARVLQRSELIAAERNYWARHTPIGLMFDLVLLIGFVVGVAFAYQVLYIVVHESLPEYAVLRSLGYSTLFLNALVFCIGATIGLGASLPAWGTAAVVTAAVRGPSGLPIHLAWAEGGLGVLAAVAMCLLAAAMAARRLRASDPIELFG